MSQEITGLNRTFIAAGSIAQYRCVRLNSASDNQINTNTSNTTVNIGVSQESASSTNPVTVALLGTTKATAAGSITKGALLKASTSGKVATTTNNGDSVVGTALESADANDVIEIQLTPGSRY